MAAISASQNHRYAEFTADSFFSRNEDATRIQNILSREIQNVEKMGVHQAKIPLSYDTIFSPHNEMTLASFTYAGAISPNNVAYQSTPLKTATYDDGAPTSTSAQAFFGQTTDTTAQTTFGGGSFRLRSPYGFVPAGIAVCNNVANGGNWSAFEVRHLAICTIGVNSAGTGFSLYVVVQSTNGTATTDFTGTLVFNYSRYLGRKLGLPDNGTWTVDLSGYTPTATTGSADADSAPYVYTEAGSWNSGLNPNWGYYEIPFTFNFEMNMGRYLVLRGTLSENMQSMVYMNDEEAQNSDVIAVLPINGGYGDIMEYNTPNFEVFEFPRPISLRYVNIWFTRGEDNLNTVVDFKGVDYIVKFALAVRSEFKTVQTLDQASNTWSTHNVRKYKM
jgi:hypothetical protein